MTRAELVERIRALSDAELRRVGPFPEADLNTIDDLDVIHQAVRLQRKSAAVKARIDADQLAACTGRRLGEDG